MSDVLGTHERALAEGFFVEIADPGDDANETCGDAAEDAGYVGKNDFLD